MLLVISIKVSCLTSLMKLHRGIKGGLMKPPGGCMKLHVGFLGGPHEASWGSHEAAWGVHENLRWGVMGASGPQEASWGIHGNLIGVSWRPHDGSWGHHDSSWGASKCLYFS